MRLQQKHNVDAKGNSSSGFNFGAAYNTLIK